MNNNGNTENEFMKLGNNFSDTLEHYRNAVIRLMQLDEIVLNKFFSLPLNLSYKNETYSLRSATKALKQNWNETLTMFNRNNSEISRVNLELESCFGVMSFDQFVKLVRNPSYGVAINSAVGFGALVRTSDFSRVKNSETVYETDYFQGDLNGIGYGNLSDQQWRIEKAERLVRELKAILIQVRSRTQLESMTVLDIGAGYGQFLSQLKNLGSRVAGLDISEHAARNAMNIFGLDIHQMSIQDFSRSHSEKFDLITMWDYIEHPDDPLADLLCCFEILSEGGYVVIKTPSISALEYEVFEGYYHSFKQEHLNYFSPNSLAQLLILAGFDLKMKIGISHMFQGLHAGALTTLAIANGKESDILIIAQKKSNV
jgi:2-polyprenyl-3-methyl-5-hydroxy-6-metoxy-1,4-benzoquinol methylase